MPPYVSVKEAVFPFNKFREFDPILGPEMRSTGEVMGIADSFGMAFAKAQLAADNALPLEGAMLHHGERLATSRPSRRSRAASTRWASRSTRRKGPRRTCAARGIPAQRGAQGARGPAERHRPDGERRGAAADQHAAGQARAARRLPAAAGGDRAARVVHDDDVGGAARRATRSCRCGRGEPACARCRSGMTLDLRQRRARRSRSRDGHRATPRWRARPREHPAPFIHESAYVDDGARDRRRHEGLALLSRDARRGDRRAVQPRAERRRDDRHAASATT